ncbi:MAG: UPF0262 family protein [Alphaproteobacteria bacterium]|nr:UPF0262 family protein [Alphaproteobacteria bacterium]
MSNESQRLVAVTLDEGSVVRWNPEIDHEREVAIFDLLEANSFSPVDAPAGPYTLHLSIRESRLVFDIRSAEDEAELATVTLATTPLRRIVRDYFTVCESYFDAIKNAAPSRIEALDMGRRGLHDEGSALLRERLEGKIDMDFDTSRRLFTLFCVLHLRH